MIYSKPNFKKRFGGRLKSKFIGNTDSSRYTVDRTDLFNSIVFDFEN